MSTERIFVGRSDELKQFDQVLRAPEGQVVLVIGQQGMGKTMLVNRMARLAKAHPDLQCGAVRYEVTPTDSPDVTMASMLDHAFEAANITEGSLDATPRRLEQWRTFLNVFKIGDLLKSLRRDPQKSTRDQFIQQLHLISKRLKPSGRAVFVIDPEKYMKSGSADDWRLVLGDLPRKIKFVFAQRLDGVLVSNDDFPRLTNLVRIPDGRLGVLDQSAIDDLIQARTTQPKMAPADLRAALARYNGHPYAVPAALDLLADGARVDELPDDPTPEHVAEAQWRRVCDEHGENAIKLLEAYTVLEVPVPDDVVEPVSGLNRIGRNVLLANPFLAGLLRDEPEGKRIYHSLLTDHIAAQLSEDAAAPYHRRAIDVYRKRLGADVRPDALSAARLPEHVLVAEGNTAFVSAFVNECTGPLLTLGLLDTAIGLSQRALELVDEGNSGEAMITGNLGIILQTRGDLDGAEAMHRKSLAINEKLARLEGMANAYGNLGNVLQKRGDLDGAEAMYRKALAINEKLGRLEGMASDYGNLGIVLRKRGDLQGAESMYRKALAINEKLGRLEGMANQYSNLGVLLEKRGDLTGARKYWEKAVDLFLRIGMPHMVQKVRGWLDSLPVETP